MEPLNFEKEIYKCMKIKINTECATFNAGSNEINNMNRKSAFKSYLCTKITHMLEFAHIKCSFIFLPFL